MCEYGIKKLDNNLNLKNIKYQLAKESDFIAYTDGSYKGPKKNGYGVVITNKDKEILITESKRAISFDKSIKDMSNIKAELIAVLRAIEIAINKEVKSITIIYDCTAIIDILKSSKVKNEFALKYKDLIKEFNNNIDIIFKKKTKEDILHNMAHKLSRCYIKTGIAKLEA